MVYTDSVYPDKNSQRHRTFMLLVRITTQAVNIGTLSVPQDLVSLYTNRTENNEVGLYGLPDV